ncbi:DoxX family membrane protein [Psychroserpens sp. Hel_I_66]|uniref:DoxX family membrane protein n=1 Tax=Psychroserpens sp. Hel_I_66 TaxID=1250004 RepID=UPI000648EBEE|nr:DoxX family membrane protein [Psychroserpens sp. Hel_I_66]
MKKHIPFLLRLIIAIILIQTLRFKFTGAPESIYIFKQIGLEPMGRIGIGILELIAGILLLIKRTAWLGALLTLGVIGGAIIMHLTILGIDVKGDGGILFFTAVATFTMASIVLFIYRKNIPFFGKDLKG